MKGGGASGPSRVVGPPEVERATPTTSKKGGAVGPTGSAFQTRQDPEELGDAPGLRGAALGRVRGIAVE